ncbi:MAG: hypothetical protein AAF328_04530 [Planctomycetota bacterium]
MGWARTLLLGDIGNRLDIGDVEQDLGHLRRRLQQAHRDLVTTEQRLVRLERENQEL